MNFTEKRLQEGLTHHQSGNFPKAEKIYRAILKKEPSHPEVNFLLGTLKLQTGVLPQAEKLLQNTLRLNPNHISARKNLGIVYQNLGKQQEALTTYEEFLTFEKNDPEVYFLLGNVLYEQGQMVEAIENYRKSIVLQPKDAEVHCNLAAALHLENHLSEALQSYENALSIDPNLVKAYSNLGALLNIMGDYQGAAENCVKALSLQPNDADAHMNLAVIFLLMGNYEKGWKEYEWRLALSKNKVLGTSQPIWNGEALNGKRIYIYSEQGFGDTIQFVRFLFEVKRRGGYVILACQEELCPFLRGFDAIDEIICNKDDAPLPPFDEYAPLLSLPGILGTRPETIPSFASYISVPTELDEKWKKYLEKDTSYKVGLSWAGASGNIFNRYRSCQLKEFAALSGIKNVTFYNLQYKAGINEPLDSPEGMEIISVEDKIADFTDRAAFINNLDLVITVDTSICHVAGSLGKKTWLLVSAVPDWRWLLEYPDTTPWYPDIQLFRQKNRDDWSDVFEGVRESLVEKMSEKGIKP